MCWFDVYILPLRIHLLMQTDAHFFFAIKPHIKYATARWSNNASCKTYPREKKRFFVLQDRASRCRIFMFLLLYIYVCKFVLVFDGVRTEDTRSFTSRVFLSVCINHSRALALPTPQQIYARFCAIADRAIPCLAVAVHLNECIYFILYTHTLVASL